MRRKISLFIIAFIIWALFSWPLDVQHAAVGMAAVFLVVFLNGTLFGRSLQQRHILQPKRYFWICCYIILFIWECIRAGFYVLLKILEPGLSLKPGIVKVKTTLRSEIGLALLANSIFFMPGTFCVDFKRREEVLYVHWLCVKSEDVNTAGDLIIGRFEAVLKRIFE